MKRFIGKFVGCTLGMALGGPMGACLGFVIGHINDLQSDRMHDMRTASIEKTFFYEFSMQEHLRPAFAHSLIILGAKLAKSDGPVTSVEVLAFRRAFRSHDKHTPEIGRLFDIARKSSEGYEPYAARLAQIFGPNSAILKDILFGLFTVAIADSSRLNRPEILFLRRTAVLFGFDEETFSSIASHAGVYLTSSPPAPKKDSAYDVLGLPTTATDDVVKRTYRALLRKHHPDKLLAAGLPASRIAEATEKVKTINAAYAEICKMRNMR